MSGKKRSKKGIESIELQIELHREKMKKAMKEGDIGLVEYYEKEIEHFETAKEKLKQRLKPKQQKK